MLRIPLKFIIIQQACGVFLMGLGSVWDAFLARPSRLRVRKNASFGGEVG